MLSPVSGFSSGSSSGSDSPYVTVLACDLPTQAQFVALSIAGEAVCNEIIVHTVIGAGAGSLLQVTVIDHCTQEK